MAPSLRYRSFAANDAEGVFATAQEAWHFTYADIFGTTFIDNFVQANYAPKQLIRLVPHIEAGRMFFQIALDASTVVGFCNIGIARDATTLSRSSIRPLYIEQGIAHTLLQQARHFSGRVGVPRIAALCTKTMRVANSFIFAIIFSIAQSMTVMMSYLWKNSSTQPITHEPHRRNQNPSRHR